MKNFFLNLWYNFRHWRYERKCIKYFGAKPETIYISEEAYDELVRRLNETPDPKSIERFRQIISKKSPWDD